MKTYLAYKQTWVTNSELQEKLWKIRETLNDIWIKNFIYFFDCDFENSSNKQIIQKARDEIKNSDLIIAFIDHHGKSEWMLQELWIAFWLEKNILSIVNNSVKDEYFLTYGLSNKTIFFDDFREVPDILKNNL